MPAHGQFKRRRITKSGNDDSITLTLSGSAGEDDDTYMYTGYERSPKTSYVLVFDPERPQHATLETVPQTYIFNLTSMPAESSAAKLAEQHPHIPSPTVEANSADQAELFDETGAISDASDREADATNPYDYRHYLHQLDEREEPPSPNIRGTPQQPPTRSAPSQKSTDRKTSTKSAQKPATNTSKSTTKKPQSSSHPSSVPTVRLDRRASTRPNDTVSNPKSKRLPPAPAPDPPSSDDQDAIGSPDNDGFEIDLGDSQPSNPSRAAAAFASPSRGGPISLASAVNSGANTPLAQTRKGDKAGDIIDFDVDVRSDSDNGYAEDDEGQQMDSDHSHDHDNDIVPMDLGPPAHDVDGDVEPDGDEGAHPHVHVEQEQERPKTFAEINTTFEGEDDDDADADADLEAEMMGLMSQDEREEPAGGSGGVAGMAEESDESEEE